MPRRDTRQGDQTAQPVVQLHRGVAVVLDWGPPLAGHLEDLFTLEGAEGNTLHVRSRTQVEGRTNETVQVGAALAKACAFGMCILETDAVSVMRDSLFTS